MRVAAEFIYDEARILIRLLGTAGDNSTPPTFVQTGTYTIDFIPTRDPYSFDLDNDQISNNEANIYISNLNPWPCVLAVTLPDLTMQSIVVNVVQQPPEEILLAPQKLETITPREPPPHFPGQAFYQEDAMSPPDFPKFWAELNFSKANVVKLPDTVSSGPLTYTGGGPGRLLTPSFAQVAANQAPWLSYAPTYLEGTFTNNLVGSSFTSTYIPTGYLDSVPVGWTIAQSDPDSLIRTFINSQDTLLPTFSIVWYLRPGFQDFMSGPPITVQTPPVNAMETLQIIFEPSPANSPGTIQLVSATGMVVGPQVLLDGPTLVQFNVGGDAGPVTIKWRQDESGAAQILNILSPISSGYASTHTFIPYGQTSAADLVILPGVSFAKYYFKTGFVRIDSDQEQAGQPLSWSLKFQTGATLLTVTQGVLQSDFSSSTVNLVSLLPTDANTMGNYKITWKSGQNFNLLTKITGRPEQSQILPFAFDLPIPDALLTQTLTYSFSSYAPLAGSSRLNYFIFRPE